MPKSAQHKHDAQLPELPDAAILAMLRHMPLQQQLRCALVCRSWAAAAALIPAAVATSFFRGLADLPKTSRVQPEDASLEAAEQRMQRMQSWLDSNSARVASLHLNLNWDDSDSWLWSNMTVRLGGQPSMPCMMQQLTSLKLCDVTLQLQSPDDSSGPLAMAAASFPALLELDLSSCRISLPSFKQLQQATALTYLSLWNNTLTAKTWWGASGAPTPKDFAAAVSNLVGQNLSLKELSIGDNDMEVEWSLDDDSCDSADGGTESQYESGSLQDLHLATALSSMRQLQQLALPSAAFSGSNLAALPSSLTLLHVSGWRQDSWYSASGALLAGLSMQAVPQLSRLTALQELDVFYCPLDPTILLRLPRLRGLSVSNPTVLVPGAQGAMKPADGTVALLAALRQLTQLQSLVVRECTLDQTGTGSAVQQAERLAALTASSHLTQLVLQLRERSCLPDQALQHLLPDGKQLPHLKSLMLMSTGPVLLGPAAVQRWVQCCPALESLFLEPVEATAEACQALLPLRASLTSLEIIYDRRRNSSGDSSRDPAAAVVQLTALKVLELSSQNLTLAGLQQLTALQGLTRLSVAQVLVPQGDGATAARARYISETLRDSEEGATPDVWQQLQWLCLELS